MKNMLNALCLGGLMALGFFVTKPVMADEWSKKTELQFSAPIEIPGKILTPGNYVFELADTESARNFVRVFSEESNGKERLITTLQVISDYRSNTPDQPIIQFDERPSGSPQAIHSWFYPGDQTGWEFVYPKR